MTQDLLQLDISDEDWGAIDLDSLDKFRPRLTRLTAISEKAEDSELALGSDIMVFGLGLYGLLKAMGVGAGLDELKDQMGRRFTRRPRPEPPTPLAAYGRRARQAPTVARRSKTLAARPQSLACKARTLACNPKTPAR